MLRREIKVGIDKANRVFDDFRESPDEFDGDLIGPKSNKLFYELYFHNRADEMAYPVAADAIGRDDTIVNLLSLNKLAEKEFIDRNQARPSIFLQQAFMTAARCSKCCGKLSSSPLTISITC